MTLIQIFVVARNIEENCRQMAVFSNFEEALKVYEEAAYVVRNSPGEGASMDDTIVTAAALFAADTLDPDLAKTMVADGRAFLMEQEEWQE